MRFEYLRLENFKCYATAELELAGGVTVIHGLNGSGKSSLLEACFFALYGARALDRTLEEIVRAGTDEATVELSFSHAGEAYRIERHVSLRESGATTDRSILETPDGTVDGARDIRATVVNLLRMDAEAFTNCAYVRQGEVNKLINATPAQRQDMIDDLLQLGRLEEYRERAGQARLGVEDVLSDRQGRLAGLDEQIAAKEERDLHGRLNTLESELTDVQAEIDRFQENRERARETLQAAEEVLETHEERQTELDRLETEIRDLEESIAETERKRDGLADDLQMARERITELEAERDEYLDATELESVDSDDVETRIGELRQEREAVDEQIQEHVRNRQEHVGEVQSLEDRADELAERAATKREEAAELEAAVTETEEALDTRREELAELSEAIASHLETIDAGPVPMDETEAHLDELRVEREALRERLSERRAEVAATRERIEEAEALLEAGKCPECGQPVDDSPHVDSLASDRDELAEREETVERLETDLHEIDERIEQAERLVEAAAAVDRLRTERENLETAIGDLESVLEEKRDRIDTLREEAEEHEDEADTARSSAADHREQAEDAKEAVADGNERKAEIKSAIAGLETLAGAIDDLEEARSTTTDLETERDRLAELNEERRERLAEKRERRTDIAEAVDADRIAEARENRDRAQEYLERVGDRLDELGSQRDALQSDIGGVRAELSELEELRAARESLAAEIDRIETLHEETADLESMYGSLRADLRRRNVATLERTLNETFELIYGNDSYSHIELDDAYELTVFQKDGQTLDPEQLSGGERALFNLSLRCAVYRLLAEGIEGPAPMPPLVLDEPTVFLDAGHVSRLVELVESMHELGVEQIIVVSHDEELVGAADDLVTVRKDPTSNRSTIEHTADPAGIPADD